MPTSQWLQISSLVELIVHANPKKMLDIGVGFGKYGYLSREYLELWDRRQVYDDWQRTIDGIEAFEKYVTPAHQFIYNTIHIGDAKEILPTLDSDYDLILLVDVLEHFTREDGEVILRLCQERSRNVLISVPNWLSDQDAHFDNVYETHRFLWEKGHFSAFRQKFILPDEGGSMVVFLGEDAARVHGLWFRERNLPRRLKKLIARGLDRLNLKKPVKRLLGIKSQVSKS